jgi:hypothetical protein
MITPLDDKGSSFFSLVDENDKATGILFYKSRHKTFGFEIVHPYYPMFGFCSFKEFPKDEPPIVFEKIIGWCHHYRNPERFGIPLSKPTILLTFSDFIDTDLFVPSNKPPEYDFSYVVNPMHTPFQRKDPTRKNWKKAIEEYLPFMCLKLTLKGLLIGKTAEDIPANLRSYIQCTGAVDLMSMPALLSSAKFSFVPSIIDASPRVITESLSVNRPVLVHADILGGWQYVTEETGAFFSSCSDLPDAIDTVLRMKCNGRTHFLGRGGGKVQAGKRLYDFVRSSYPQAPAAKYYGLKPIKDRDIPEWNKVWQSTKHRRCAAEEAPMLPSALLPMARALLRRLRLSLAGLLSWRRPNR